MKKFLLCATAAAALTACNNGSSTKTGSTDSTLNNA
ncbi:lipoprotein, partial [Chitinophaga sp.]